MSTAASASTLYTRSRDGTQQRVLLRAVEAVDLVEEEHGGAVALARPLDHRPDLGAPGFDRAVLLVGGAAGAGDDPRQRRLARAGRAVEDHRVQLPALDRPPQRRAGCEQRALADDLLERLRAHPHRERFAAAGLARALFEQALHR
jgi:hypothetical protein